ncbi:MAG TPA: DUF1501 domain-containing protein, partial [Gemmata sp.]|nr:DUF1501 domain-containing protein [Gemmata sp.]
MNLGSTLGLPHTLSRRELLARSGTGLGMLGLAGLLAGQGELVAETVKSTNPLAPKSPHIKPKAKHVIHLFMNGGPSQVDTFDPKPELTKQHGKKPTGANLKTERGTNALFKSPFEF